MRERGILMSGPMVRAILAGKKTQTRRAVRAPEVCPDCIAASIPHPNGDGGMGLFGSAAYLRIPACDHFGEPVLGARVRCPYGAPGDRLWVRETWAGDDFYGAVYRADHPSADLKAGELDSGEQSIRQWRPSLLMPRWASRITLEVTGIRVERAQDISDADIEAEGVDAEAVDALWAAAKQSRRAELWPFAREALADRGPPADWRAIDNWRAAWTLINGRASWDANPWVWVVSFRRTP